MRSITSVSLPVDLHRRAKEMGISISGTLVAALINRIAEIERTCNDDDTEDLA